VVTGRDVNHDTRHSCHGVLCLQGRVGGRAIGQRPKQMTHQRNARANVLHRKIPGRQNKNKRPIVPSDWTLLHVQDICTVAAGAVSWIVMIQAAWMLASSKSEQTKEGNVRWRSPFLSNSSLLGLSWENKKSVSQINGDHPQVSQVYSWLWDSPFLFAIKQSRAADGRSNQPTSVSLDRKFSLLVYD